MKSMSASFKCQGYGNRIESLPDIVPIDVTLETDGCAVLIRPSQHTGAVPPLTPDGWLELAGHARRLVDDANAAWRAMGAMPDA